MHLAYGCEEFSLLHTVIVEGLLLVDRICVVHWLPSYMVSHSGLLRNLKIVQDKYWGMPALRSVHQTKHLLAFCLVLEQSVEIYLRSKVKFAIEHA